MDYLSNKIFIFRNYSGTLNKSTNTDFGHKDPSNKGFIAKLKMTSVGINLQN